MLASAKAGPQIVADGAEEFLRLGRGGELLVQELHGRFAEQVFRGSVYSNGSTITALSANTITLTSSTTPILGVWNPSTSSVNLIILQAALTVVANNLTSGAGPGVFVWASSLGNSAISTGSTPYNRKTLAQSGSAAKGMSFVALTGLTNNLVIMEGADFPSPSGLTYTTLGSTAVMPGFQATQNVDGSLFVPPGGVLALLNTTSCTTFSVAGRLLWEEAQTA
jgi:hypothetical protein